MQSCIISILLIGSVNLIFSDLVDTLSNEKHDDVRIASIPFNTSSLKKDHDSGPHIAALILARGGSKGIRWKNLVQIQGVSLLKRSLLTIHKFGKFTSVWVSTDSDAIAEEALSGDALVHKRSVESATDSAPSIVGVLDFVRSHPEVDIVGLIQCTSPFLETSFLHKAFMMIQKGHYESVFSVTREFKLRWQESADNMVMPLNFDPGNRPRRQDWSGELIENGMFYFASKMLIHQGLLQGGRIGFVEVPANRSHEIDTWYDLEVAQLFL